MQLNRRNLLKMAPVALVPTVAVAAPIVAAAKPVKDMSVLEDYFMKTWTLPGGMKGEIVSIKFAQRSLILSREHWIVMTRPQLREPRMVGCGDLYIYMDEARVSEKMFHRGIVWAVAQHDAEVIGIHPDAINRFATAIEDCVNDSSFCYDIAIKLYTGLPEHPSKDLYSPEFMLPAIFPEKPDWI